MCSKHLIMFSLLEDKSLRMDRSKVGELMVIAGNSHPELAELIAKYISHSFLSKY